MLSSIHGNPLQGSEEVNSRQRRFHQEIHGRHYRLGLIGYPAPHRQVQLLLKKGVLSLSQATKVIGRYVVLCFDNFILYELDQKQKNLKSKNQFSPTFSLEGTSPRGPK